MPRRLRLVHFQPEIERHLRQIRKNKREQTSLSALEQLEEEMAEQQNFPVHQPRNGEHGLNGDQERVGENHGNNRRRTIREATTSDVNYDPFTAACPNFDVDFEVKGLLINSLPKFHGLAGEDPYMHLQALSMICQSMKPVGANLDQVLWKVFHLSLEGKAREWYMSLPRHVANAYHSWANLRKAFLEKYFPASRTSSMRKEIYSAKQEYDESLYDYWNRFQDLLSRCPHHQIPDEQLVQYFYDGVKNQEKGMLDAASGGSLIDLTAPEAWALIKRMALNHQQYSVRDSRGVHEVGALTAHAKRMESLESKVDSLEHRITSQLSSITAELKNLNVHRSAPSTELTAPSCETCGSVMHISSVCPGRYEEVSAVYPGRQNQKWDPYSNTYNEGWRSHPNFSWRNNDGSAPNRFQPGIGAGSSNNQFPDQQALTVQPPKEDTNQLLHNMMTLMKEERNFTANQFNAIANLIQQDSSKNAARFNALEKRMEQWETRAANMNTYVTQLSNNLSEIQARSSGTIPSNTVINPKSLNAIELRSGKQVQFSVPDEEEEVYDEEIECEEMPLPKEKIKKSGSAREEHLLKEKKQSAAAKEKEPTPRRAEEKSKNEKSSEHGAMSKEVNLRDLPFPNSYLMSKKINEIKQEKEIVDLFGKVEINVPLLDLVKRVPAYAKYLKDLCTNKRKFRPNERVQVSSNVSALFKPQIPVKCQDPGSFTIPCVIGKVPIGKSLLDLGAAINVMPKSVYEALGVKSLKPTSVVLQLADRSFRHPVGILEDILVQVKGLVFPADFYVLDMSTDVVQDTSLILGRPFLRTASTMINMKEGKITMEVGDQQVSFNMYEAMKHPHEDYSLLGVNMLDIAVDDACAEFEQHLTPLTYDSFGGIFADDIVGAPSGTGMDMKLPRNQAAETELGYQPEVHPELTDPP